MALLSFSESSYKKYVVQAGLKFLGCAVLITSTVIIPNIYASESALEEIVVTARKRQESLNDIPMTINAFSSENLQNLGVRETADIALYTPNFTWNTEFGRASPQPFLRGIGTNNFAPINSGPIAVYQDHVVIGPNIVQGFSTFDLERVEILKGPQSTLYGRNSTGGLINFISKKPEIGAGTNGFVNAEFGRFSTTNFEGAIGFDLGDKAAMRIAAERNLNKGSFDNRNPLVDSDDVGSVDDVAFRAAIVLEPSERLSILANLHHAEADPDTAPFKFIGLVNPEGGGQCPNPGIGSGCTDAFGLGATGVPGFYSTEKGIDFEETSFTGGFVKVDFDISDTLSLQAITSYDESELERLDDDDDTSVELQRSHYADEFEAFSQEARLTYTGEDYGWHLGAYYYDESNEGLLLFSQPVFGTSEGNLHEIDTESYAVFGQIDWNLTETIRLGAGLRWTYEEKDVKRYDAYHTAVLTTSSIFRSEADLTITPGSLASGTTGAKDFDRVSGGISIDYTTDAGHLIYATISRGVKGGDINGAAIIQDFIGTPRTPEQIAQFEFLTRVTGPETLDSFELGFKSDLLDGRLRVNGALFYYIYKDQQQTVLQPDPTGLSVLGITTLTAGARSEIPGAELEVSYLPTSRWFLQANIGLLDATYDEFVNPLPGAEDFSGNQIPLTADIEFSVLGRYEVPLDNGATLSLQMDASYKGETFFQAQNDAGFGGAQLQEDSVTLLNARIGYRHNDNWSIAVFGKNLTGEEYLGSGFDLTALGYVAVKPGPRRYFGVELMYEFGE